MSDEIKIPGVNSLIGGEERTVEIEAPPEEMKAFQAGCRVGYKTGFAAGYQQRILEEDKLLGIEPSETLWNKPS